MNIKTVTITGADSGTDIGEMVKISKDFPFVEWGILFSPKRTGEPRYPDFDWVVNLSTKWHSDHLRLSAHVCGGYTKEMLLGKDELFKNSPVRVFQIIFNRFQLNFNASKNEIKDNEFFSLLFDMDKNFIFQFNYSNIGICSLAMEKLDKVSFLYDSSGGRGNIAKEWQEPFSGFFTGYAGGLSPDNLEAELLKIEKVAGDSTIWIDVESMVRSEDGFSLDMVKVRRFLEIASKYVSWE